MSDSVDRQRDDGADDRRSLALLAPTMILAMMPAVWIALAVSESASWASYLVIAAVPFAATLWLLRRVLAVWRLLAAFGSVILAALVAAVVVFAVTPLFAIPDVGISGAGVYTLMFGPYVVLLLGSALVRGSLRGKGTALWLGVWLVTASSPLWLERVTYLVTDFLRIDAIGGTIAALATPSFALAAWLGVLGAWSFSAVHLRYVRSH